MKALRIAIGVIVALLAIFVVGGLVLPSKTTLSRSVVIQAPPAAIFAHLNDLRKFYAWSPWKDMEPEAEVKFSEAVSGPGASYSWHGKKLGEGSMTISRLEPNRMLETALDFKEQGKALARFELQTVEGGTQVTWFFESEAPGFGDRWMGLVMQSMLGGQYETGLQALKKVVEAEAAAH
ncbi:MAG: SRPBCC family protein [Leptospirales bacterium]|nr:SRPBCC family protein [Leptospirales bacterium]